MTACSQPVQALHTLSYKATLTDGVFLVIPGLLAPEAMDSIPVEAAPIGRFLSRSERQTDTSTNTSDGLESLIARWFNASTESGIDAVSTQPDTAAARMGYRTEIATDSAPKEVLCVDPVYHQMDINHATVSDQSLLNLTAEESSAIIGSLNLQFGGDGLAFTSEHPLRWYCQFDNVLKIEALPLSVATGRDASLCRPSGDDARRWRTLLAEIEMILFSHPVNQQREARGELPVNSVWLWGGGDLPETGDNNGSIYTNNFYTRSYANHAGMLTHDIADFSLHKLPVLLVDNRLAIAAATADIALRKQVIEQLTDVVFAALDQSRGVLKRGAPVSLWCGGNQLWHLPERIDLRSWLIGLCKVRSYESFITNDGIETPASQPNSSARTS